MQVLVIGGSGGIGSAIIRHILANFPQAKVTATWHNTAPQLQDSRLNWHTLDASSEAEVAQLSRQFNSLDWIINCVGMLHSGEKGPEKSQAAIDSSFFINTIRVNTLPSLLLARYFTPVLKPSRHPVFAVLSARVGSIGDNRLGGWYSYRMSKAALNMLVKTLSIEWQRSLKKGCVLALHPGTTDTALSAPFQANVPDGKLFNPDKVAADLVGIIASATPSQSGQFLAYDGQRICW